MPIEDVAREQERMPQARLLSRLHDEFGGPHVCLVFIDRRARNRCRDAPWKEHLRSQLLHHAQVSLKLLVYAALSY
jgi:hypothetical protein